jgi:lysophospholipid acyltransferase (LPLAT)-like uncharacterized protein
MLRAWWRRVRPQVASGAVYFVFRCLSMTWRVKAIRFEESLALPGGKILFGWHGRTMVGAKFFRNMGFWAIISLSRDGEMQDRIFRRLGFKTIRGSTGRGGARALVESIRVLRAGGVMALTPDGPRGPSGVIQPGILMMAQKSGAWLVPCGVSASSRKLVRSWDRYMVPYPFARCLMIYGNGVQIPRDATEQEVDSIRLALEAETHRLEAEAEKAMGH